MTSYSNVLSKQRPEGVPGMPIDMTYDESLDYLKQFVNYEARPQPTYDTKHFNLIDFADFLHGLGSPHLAFPSIHVAGSKGKGSTAAMIAAMLSQAGLRTGLFTSPHLVTIRERVQIDRQPFSQPTFAGLISELRHHLKHTRSTQVRNFRTFFELLTALAFLYFARQNVDIAVVEVGLGGRLDSTNILSPEIAVITPIGFEHTHILGNTLRAIATEKAGIIKPHGTVILAPQEAEVINVVEKKCQRQQASLYLTARDFNFSSRETTMRGNRIDFLGFGLEMKNLAIPLIGQHQAVNAAVALAAVGHLRRQGWNIDEHHLRQGLAGVTWPGRLEVIDNAPCVVVDAAHTVESARCLATALATLFHHRQLHLILGLASDKQIHRIVEILAPMANTVTATGFSSPRAFDPCQLAALLQTHCAQVHISNDPATALHDARAKAAPDDLICITGSLILLGELKARLAGKELEF
jgi:dihydrofolate synthase/folylpolyglutamate synthase